MLNHIYGNLIRPSGNVQLNGKFMEYDQTEVVSSARKKRFLLTGTLDVNSYIQSVLNTYLPGGSGIGLLPNFSNPLLDWWKNLLPGSGSGGSSGSGGGSGSGGSLPGISLPGVGGGTSAKSGIDSVGYAYIPSSCIGGSECMLHIAMHGCKMGRCEERPPNEGSSGYHQACFWLLKKAADHSNRCMIRKHSSHGEHGHKLNGSCIMYAIHRP
ncbi:hypothetical protein ACJMK2_010186 [Sinanodonta woodiana]|uniref:Uncharacterized protein n=1 Tax=Sinanodonta woodiana TaxID=1069815 RepID=A0ABD3VEV2_SINWO